MSVEDAQDLYTHDELTDDEIHSDLSSSMEKGLDLDEEMQHSSGERVNVWLWNRPMDECNRHTRAGSVEFDVKARSPSKGIHETSDGLQLTNGEEASAVHLKHFIKKLLKTRKLLAKKLANSSKITRKNSQKKLAKIS